MDRVEGALEKKQSWGQRDLRPKKFSSEMGGKMGFLFDASQMRSTGLLCNRNPKIVP